MFIVQFQMCVFMWMSWRNSFCTPHTLLESENSIERRHTVSCAFLCNIFNKMLFSFALNLLHESFARIAHVSTSSHFIRILINLWRRRKRRRRRSSRKKHTVRRVFLSQKLSDKIQWNSKAKTALIHQMEMETGIRFLLYSIAIYKMWIHRHKHRHTQLRRDTNKGWPEGEFRLSRNRETRFPRQNETKWKRPKISNKSLWDTP